MVSRSFSSFLLKGDLDDLVAGGIHILPRKNDVVFFALCDRANLKYLDIAPCNTWRRKA
jgi:hypothetical protein